MNMSAIIGELRKERGRLDEAILALERLSAITGRGRTTLELVRGDSAPAQAGGAEHSALKVTAGR
jgi:hypothetical protein